MNKRHNGSFTVEAALILPMVIFIILAIIFLTFYLYDVCSIEDVTDKVLHQAALTLKHEANITTGVVDYPKIRNRGVFYLLTGDTEEEEAAIEAYLWQELGRGLFFAKITDIQVTAGKWKVTVSVKAEFRIPVRGIMDFFQPDIITYEVVRPVHNPAESIRISEVILNTGAKIKGLDTLKNQLDNILN
jgi:hypothetical protein